MFTPFFKIKTVDEARREVGGLITSETVDKDQETLDYSGSKPHFQAWSDEAYNSTKSAGQAPSYGNLREQHGKRMAGKFSEPLKFDDTAKTIHGVAKIYDDDIWQKVVDGAYTGFSVGGSLAAPVKKVGNRKFITIVPREVSLVDNPAVSDAHFDFIRAADGQVVKTAFRMADPRYRLKSAVSELLDAVKFLAPELAPTAEQINAPGAIEPVPVPEQDGSKVASKDMQSGTEWATPTDAPNAGPNEPIGNPSGTYAPDAIPDKNKPEATQPIDGQAHMAAEPRKYDATPALTVAAPDTQLGTESTAAHQPGSNEMIGLDGDKMASLAEISKAIDALKAAIEKHDKPDEPATMGTAVTPDPKIETDPIGHVAEDFGMTADKPEPEADEDDGNMTLKVAPAGWKGSVEAMKDRPEIDNPYALAWWMDSGGYTPRKLSKAAATEFQAAYTKFAEAFTSEKRAVSDKERADLADKGHAMPDGSYPIASVSDLHNAVQAFGRAKNKPAVKAHIKRRAAQLGAESALPDSWKAAGTAENAIRKSSTGANQMASTEVTKAARLSLHDHLAKMKAAASKHSADISDMCDKCMKLAGEPVFDADTESEGGQPATGEAADTEVKAASAQIEKLSGMVKTLTAQVEALTKTAPKTEEKETEKASKSEAVVGDRSKAAPVKAEVTVEKVVADAKQDEENTKLWKAANGIRTETIILDGKAVERNVPCAPDLNARNALYNKLTNAKVYMAAGQVARPSMR